MLPLAFAIGAGSQMLQPLAIAVIGGVLISMVLSLIITPAVHFYLSREGRADEHHIGDEQTPETTSAMN
jgi:Cu/Ag efflux pump CusA